MVYRGYSTTQVFYGQQSHFFMTRWQGSDGDHESGKCKEFIWGELLGFVPVRGYSPFQAGSGNSIRVHARLFTLVHAVGDRFWPTLGTSC